MNTHETEAMKIEERVGRLLRDKKLTLSTAESCTGGGIAALLTSVAGSSDYFKGAIVAYRNEVKEELLGVSAGTIEQYNVVSEETVKEMVCGAKRTLRTDCAVATTGIAGPGGGDDERPTGTIWIAASCGDRTVTMKQEGDKGRENNIARAIQTALFMLEKLLRE